MAMLTQPQQPQASPYYSFYQYLEAKADWRKFIPGWEKLYKQPSAGVAAKA